MSDYSCQEEYDAAMEGEAQEAAQSEADACEGEALAEQQNIESARHALQQLKAEIAAYVKDVDECDSADDAGQLAVEYADKWRQHPAV